MKTKFLKFGLPLMVFLLAIVFAFATNEKSERESNIITGYIFANGNCNVTAHDCLPQGSQICTIGTQTVYSTKSGTLCMNPLRWK